MEDALMRNLLLAAVLFGVFQPTARAENHAIGARIGFLGIGVDYAYRATERIAIRVGLNGSGISFDETESGIAYAFDLDFDSAVIGIDIHPMKGKFRFSTGVLKNDSSLSATAEATQSITIGDTVYQAAAVGNLTGRVGFDGSAPFLGFGWDWRPEKRVGIALDFGVVSQGAPIVSLRADGPIADDPAFVADLAAEQAELQQSLDDLDVYPFATFGIVARF
jgi:hypothetical protein